MSTFGHSYAGSYDLLYQEKDYEGEVDFLQKAWGRYNSSVTIGRVADFGCGTGGHALCLARRGFAVVGVDNSPKMVEIARRKVQASGLSNQASICLSDIQAFNGQARFDSICCMFAVLSYQVDNDSLCRALHSVRRNLKPGGIFISDIWHGPGVLTDPPTERARVVEGKGERIIRIAKPDLDALNNTVAIRYHLFRLREEELIEEAEEIHRLRYFFRPEIQFLFAQASLELVGFHSAFQLDMRAVETDWSVSVIARAV
jgi:SAM-dependent methyltransferase